MITSFDIYLIESMNNFGGLIGFLGVICAPIAIFNGVKWIIFWENIKEDKENDIIRQEDRVADCRKKIIDWNHEKTLLWSSKEECRNKLQDNLVEKMIELDKRRKDLEIANNKARTHKHYTIVSMSVFVILMAIAILMPSTQTAREMYLIPKLANSKLAQQLPSYLEQYIQKVIKEKS